MRCGRPLPLAADHSHIGSIVEDDGAGVPMFAEVADSEVSRKPMQGQGRGSAELMERSSKNQSRNQARQ